MTSSATPREMGDTPVSRLRKTPKRISAQINWSEYVNGAWSPAKSSQVKEIGAIRGDFDRQALAFVVSVVDSVLHVTFDGALRCEAEIDERDVLTIRSCGTPSDDSSNRKVGVYRRIQGFRPSLCVSDGLWAETQDNAIKRLLGKKGQEGELVVPGNRQTLATASSPDAMTPVFYSDAEGSYFLRPQPTTVSDLVKLPTTIPAAEFAGPGATFLDRYGIEDAYSVVKKSN